MISIRSYGGEAMGTTVGLGGVEARASPRKGEDDNDDLCDGAPPEWHCCLS